MLQIYTHNFIGNCISRQQLGPVFTSCQLRSFKLWKTETHGVNFTYYFIIKSISTFSVKLILQTASQFSPHLL